VHRHNARLPGSGQSAVGGTGAGLSDRRATCVTAESWCGRAAGIDGPTWVMATYKIADCTRYIPYIPQFAESSQLLLTDGYVDDGRTSILRTCTNQPSY
jgi:hypothetical protein